MRDWKRDLANVREKLDAPKLRNDEMLLDTQGMKTWEDLHKEGSRRSPGAHARGAGC